MAYKSVVSDTFFDAIIAILKQTERERGPFALAMLSPSFPNKRRWDTVFSAPWLDPLSGFRGMDKMREILEKDLGPALDRLGFVRTQSTQSPMARTLIPTFDVEQLGTAYAFTSLEQQLFDLDEVIVLVARPELVSRPELKLSA